MSIRINGQCSVHRGFNPVRYVLCLLISFFFAGLMSAMTQQAPVSYSQAEALLQQGKIHEALPLLLELLQSEPGNSKICLQLGIAYTQLQQLEKAAEFYRKALKISPGLVSARKNLATVLWFLNRKQQSIQEFAAVLKVLPNDPVPHLYLGTFEYEQERFLKAKSHFEKAGDLALKNPEALPMVVESYLAVKDLNVPTHLMEQLEQAENPSPQLVLQLGALFIRYKIYDQCSKALEKLVKLNSAQPDVYLMLGEAYDKQGMPEKAYNAFAKAIEINPRLEEGYIALSSFASDHQNKEFALKILSQGLQKIPGSSKLELHQGVLWALEGDLLQAQKSFLRACQADARWVLPILALGISQLQESKSAEAASTFQQAAMIAPDDYRPEYFYALALTRAGEQDVPSRREKIISALRKSIVLDPGRPEPHLLLGRTYLAADQVDAAVVELGKVLKLDSQNPTALYQLGIAYRKQGRSAEAERLLRAFEETKAKLKEEEDQERKALVQILKTVK